MPASRSNQRRISAGIILVDRLGRVLMQHRDDDPSIMFPDHWGLTGGAGHPGETPEETARREVEEETGMLLERFEPFRAYYFNETTTAKKATTARADYELYLFHAPCETPVEEMICGEGRALRFFAPDDLDALAIAYNHRDVLAEFFASPVYARYVHGAAFDDDAGTERIDPLAAFVAAVETGEPWFEALMRAIAVWEQPAERVGEREYRYLIGGEAFDWLLLAERLLDAAPQLISSDEAERLLFSASPPDQGGRGIDDETLRGLIGEPKHRAHLNYVYGVTVEEALQYAVELELTKERLNVAIRDPRDDDTPADPVFERIYGRTRASLLEEFRDGEGLEHGASIPLPELRAFTYWLFKYRVKNAEPARVASDTRKALAQLSAIEDGVRRRRAAEREAEAASARG